MTIPRATIRLQFNRAFTFDDAIPHVGYFAQLGISHVYASPVLTARAGSIHGYDTVDHGAVNPELGGEPALRRLVGALRQAGLGLILDIVPNHMAVGGGDNAWWLDVLEWGSDSPYAAFFDIDWRSPDRALRGKVLAPFLGKPYAQCLADGDLVLKFDAGDGRLYVAYHQHRFPVRPSLYGTILEGHDFPGALVSAFARASALNGGQGHSALAELRQTLRAEVAGGGSGAMDALLCAYGTGSSDGRERLHVLLEQQNFRLCWWRLASDCINWRRFFDVTELAALRADRPEVFEATHAVILRLYAEGLIDGVRVDHVDGLADPGGYCRTLRQRLDGVAASRPAGAPEGPPYLIVEKILAPDEELRTSWQTDGTTGYDFMSEVSATQHDAAGEAGLTRLWHDLSGRQADFETEALAAKDALLANTFAGEWEAMGAALGRIAAGDPQGRDLSRGSLRRALARVLRHTPRYRLYSGAPLDHDDRAVLAATLRRARQSLDPLDRRALRFIARLLARRAPPGGATARRRVALRIQQLSAPLTAKAVEDTAFYRYGRALSRNEVGSSPAQFAITPDQFHAACRQRHRRFPQAMVATATHDHKRGEDLRARLAVLSEMPDAWGAAVRHWMTLNAPLRTRVGEGWAPDAPDEIMLYQMVVGAWPLTLLPDDRDGMQPFADRLATWQLKALREAKRHTAWVTPRRDYEDASRDFLMRILCEQAPSRTSLHAFATRMQAAGATNGLAQALLRMTTPGVPDLYQGTELWDFSLVDPDNRWQVDFELRQHLLARDSTVEALLSGWRDGGLKQALIARTLDLRRRRAALFAEGDYLPLRPSGVKEANLLAFARRRASEAIIVVATRLPLGLQAQWQTPSAPPGLWQDTAVTLPAALHGTGWRNVLDGGRTIAAGRRLSAGDVLRTLPVALLEPV